MKFDITRAWKDENYRQSLSEEQLSALPANPAGELGDAELSTVFGGGFDGNGVFGASSSAAATSVNHTHSFAVICDIAIFSVNLLTVPIIPIVSPTNQCCANCD